MEYQTGKSQYIAGIKVWQHVKKFTIYSLALATANTVSIIVSRHWPRGPNNLSHRLISHMQQARDA